MHLYVAARGIVDQLNRWENDLLALKLPYVIGHQHSEAGPKDIVGMHQLGVRPVRMYEISFPEPQLNTVLNLVKPTQSWNPNYDKYTWAMRKALGLNKIPEMVVEDKFASFNHDWIDCTGIGLKKDRFENGIEMI